MFRTRFYALPTSLAEVKEFATLADARAYIASKVDAGERGYAHGLIDFRGWCVAEQYLKKENGSVTREEGEENWHA